MSSDEMRQHTLIEKAWQAHYFLYPGNAKTPECTRGTLTVAPYLTWLAEHENKDSRSAKQAEAVELLRFLRKCSQQSVDGNTETKDGFSKEELLAYVRLMNETTEDTGADSAEQLVLALDEIGYSSLVTLTQLRNLSLEREPLRRKRGGLGE